MPLSPIAGHHEARRRLAHALRAGRLPQVLLLTGPAGVGKQRLALWLAQLLACERGGPEPCGECRRCRLVCGLAYADLHWFVPIPRPKAADPDKQVDEAAELLAEAMEARRGGTWPPPDGMASHAMASVRLLQRRAAMTSVEGGARVFIVGHAERLVPQEANPEAANALLKLLEEPPPGAYFMLTTLDPRRVLPTIRSRAVPVRLGRVADAEVRAFLENHASPPLRGAELDERVALAGGAIGAATTADGTAGEPYRAARELLEAVLGGPGPALERALRQPPFQARGEFSAMLDALADTLGEAARGTLGHPLRRSVPDALLRHRSPAPLLQAIERVGAAREAAWGNVNPQLLLAVLGEELAEVL
ncbi:MAG TPA: hypothetical protein VFZ26_08535 [Gemmatimonadales bacterium]